MPTAVRRDGPGSIRPRMGMGAGRLTALAAVVMAGSPGPAALSAQALPSVRDTLPLFASDEPLAVTFLADFTALDGDRSASPDRPGVLTVVGSTGDSVAITMRIRTRGEFRLDPSNCSFPPLRIDVRASEAVGTPFEGQDDLNVVSSCRPERASYAPLVVLEYLAYRALGLVTDRSFRVRPLTLTLVDTGDGAEPATRFAFVIEDDDALAERLGLSRYELVEGRALPPVALDDLGAVTAGVFEYMIGNTDWSDVAGHNVQILDRGGVAIPVPYDFDFSGLVDAPYAAPSPDAGVASVRERRYRGWCRGEMITRLVLERFRSARQPIVALFADEPALDEETRRRAVRYLEGFFDDIETDERAERRFLRDCRLP